MPGNVYIHKILVIRLKGSTDARAGYKCNIYMQRLLRIRGETGDAIIYIVIGTYVLYVACLYLGFCRCYYHCDIIKPCSSTSSVYQFIKKPKLQ